MTGTACGRRCSGAQDRNAGFSQANPQRLYLPVVADPEYQPAAVNVEAQQNNPTSLLWWMRRLIARAAPRSRSLSRGGVEFLYPGQPQGARVPADARGRDGPGRRQPRAERPVRRARPVAFRREVPVEMFGPTEFPRIGQLPYFVTLGPYGFYWFRLRPDERPEERASSPARSDAQLVGIVGHRARPTVARRTSNDRLPRFLVRQRWFGAKGRRIATVRARRRDPRPRRDGEGRRRDRPRRRGVHGRRARDLRAAAGRQAGG